MPITYLAYTAEEMTERTHEALGQFLSADQYTLEPEAVSEDAEPWLWLKTEEPLNKDHPANPVVKELGFEFSKKRKAWYHRCLDEYKPRRHKWNGCGKPYANGAGRSAKATGNHESDHGSATEVVTFPAQRTRQSVDAEFDRLFGG